jgi:hypothetical protein
MAGLGPAIHDFADDCEESRGWPAFAGHDSVRNSADEKQRQFVSLAMTTERAVQEGHWFAFWYKSWLMIRAVKSGRLGPCARADQEISDAPMSISTHIAVVKRRFGCVWGCQKSCWRSSTIQPLSAVQRALFIDSLPLRASSGDLGGRRSLWL